MTGCMPAENRENSALLALTPQRLLFHVYLDECDQGLSSKFENVQAVNPN